MNRRIRSIFVAACAWVPALAAVAALEVNSQPSGPARPHAKSEGAKRAQPDKAPFEGVVTALDATGARVQIQGQWYTVAAGHTQVSSGGKQVPASSLKVGQKLKFNLAAGGDSKTLGTVYAP